MLLTQALLRNRRFFSNALATLDGPRRRTWREHVDRVARLAAGIRDAGGRPGDRIGLLAWNSDYFLEAQHATFWGGFVSVPLNTRWSVDENIAALEDADIDLLFVDRANAAGIDAFRRAVPSLRIIGADFREGADAMIEDMVGRFDPLDPFESLQEDLAAIYFTGGSTGRSKGVMLNHLALWSSAALTSRFMAIDERSRYLHASPMFHMGDGAPTLATTLSAGSHFFLPVFRATGFVDLVQSHGVTHTLLGPTMIGFVMNEPGFDAGRLASMQVLAFGSAPMQPALHHRLIESLSHVRLTHCYGQTEMGPLITSLDPKHQKIGDPRLYSVGKPHFCTEVKLVRKDGSEAGIDEPGEIWARGINRMMGYWKRPKETASALVEGWLRTGDIATMDAEGYLYICDRDKDMIISGGENIFSAEVEAIVGLHPAVAMNAAIGVPNERFGETVHSIIVLHEGRTLTFEELSHFCRQHIGGYKCPRSMEVRPSLPLSPAGKVLKHELRAEFWKDQPRMIA